MMRDFELWLNTRFLFGRDVHKKAGSVLRQMGVSRVLIHHDSGAYLYDTGFWSRSGVIWKTMGWLSGNCRA